jgi:Ser/Thr protein kinase RdoA (MazF antagonist)
MFEYVPYQSVRTLIGRNIIEIDMRQIGRALGEYHSFTLGEGVSTDYALLQARRTHFFAESAFSLLDTRKIPIRFGMREVDLLTKDMIRNPGKATFVHGDFHAGNVLTEGKNIPVIIDHELLPRFLRLDGTPQGMPALDLNEFLFPLKYVYPKENKHLSSEFLGGYREICNLPITGEANLYSHVHVELANLHGMMMNNQNINVIMQVVDHLNTILARPG